MLRMMENGPGRVNERCLAQSSPFASWPTLLLFLGKTFVIPMQAGHKVSSATLSPDDVKLVIPSPTYKTLATTSILHRR